MLITEISTFHRINKKLMEGQKCHSEVVSKLNVFELRKDEDTGEDIKSDDPIIIKASYTEEIYHGKRLKSRIELSKSLELPKNLDKCPIRPPLQAVKMNESENYWNSENAHESENEWQVRYRLPHKRRDKNLKSFKLNDTCHTFQKQREKQSCFHICISIFAIILILFLLGKYIFPYIHYSSGPISFDKVEKELYKQILHQSSSIFTIVESLNALKNPPKKILTCLVGPTGVGKSHLINILNEEIGINIQIFHSSDLLNLSSKKSIITEELHRKLYYSNFFVVVIDDLKIDNIERLKKSIEIIFSMENTNILLFTVFNLETAGCLDNSSESITNPSVIKKHLEHFSQNFYFAHFNSLDRSIVIDWLVKEIENQKFSPKIKDKLVGDLLKQQDIKCHGLKGLHSKLLLELSHYNKVINNIKEPKI